MAASGATEVVADADQVINHPLSFDVHTVRIEILGWKIGIGNMFGQIKAFDR